MVNRLVKTIGFSPIAMTALVYLLMSANLLKTEQVGKRLLPQTYFREPAMSTRRSIEKSGSPLQQLFLPNAQHSLKLLSQHGPQPVPGPYLKSRKS
jgi:hypothetical protein